MPTGKRSSVSADQAFLKVDGDTAEAVAWSPGVSPGELDLLRERHAFYPGRTPAVWRSFLLIPGRACLSQTMMRYSRPQSAMVHAVLLTHEPDIDAFAWCQAPETFTAVCSVSGGELPAVTLEPQATEASALSRLAMVGDPLRLASLIEAAAVANPSRPLWLVPAGPAATLSWFSGLSLCLPQAWRQEVTFSTLETPREELPYAWIGLPADASAPSRGRTFRVADDVRPTEAPLRWSRAVADSILARDWEGVQRLADGVQVRRGDSRTQMLDEAGRNLPATGGREALLEKARAAKG